MEWISVKDRLPKKYEEVFVFPFPSEYAHTATYGKFNNTEIDDCWFFGEYEQGYGHENYKCNVTHWMSFSLPAEDK